MTMFQNYRGCWVRSTPRDDARRGGYSYEVVIVVHKRSLPLQVRHKYRGAPFPAILEAQQEGLRWAIAAIDEGRVAANVD